MSASELLSLKWNNHNSAFLHRLKTIKSQDLYSDATLACDGRFYPVHKLVLSTCSEYFEQMFERTQCKHPVIVLKDVKAHDLDALLNYMYIGEVNVLQNDLAGLIKAAECLRIKGLAVPDEANGPTTATTTTGAPAAVPLAVPISENKENKRSVTAEESSGAKRQRIEEELEPVSQRPAVTVPSEETEPLSRSDSPVPVNDEFEDPQEDFSPSISKPPHPPSEEDPGLDSIAVVKEEPSEGKQEIYTEETLLQVGLDNHMFKTSAPPYTRPFTQREALHTWEPPPGNPATAATDGGAAFNTAEFTPQQLAAAFGGEAFLLTKSRGGSNALYLCEFCPKRFNHKGDYVRHTRTHTGEKPFKCPQCDHRAAQKGNIRSHAFKVHKLVLE
ncbi:zinc finger protein 131-like isoform X2 [Oratosquilla oratoria]|uniref:zinc finger protein 131-like isoform X2 n=1 Tax=Oratosquilla oratoria TaxID=337810 RepID=UPI003F771B5A